MKMSYLFYHLNMTDHKTDPLQLDVQQTRQKATDTDDEQTIKGEKASDKAATQHFWSK